MNGHFFSINDKLSDMILAQPQILPTLARFDIALGFGDKSIGEVCKMHNVDPQFFLLISNVYSNQQYLPSINEIKTTSMSGLVPYLKKSHHYYLNTRLPHIEEHLEHIANMLPNKKAKLAFTSFFQAYREEVMEHFNYEEVNVYPYIESLQQNSDDRSYNIDTFLNSHGNLQETLNDLTQIIFKYLPQNDASDDAIDVIFDILQFSQDLYKHSLIEERVLAPYVKLLEHARV